MTTLPSAPLLLTKLAVPGPRLTLVQRPRLAALFGPHLARRLTLASAPPGFGKTTLVSQWLHTTNWPLAWLSLDAQDNDPVRFWTYLVAALRRISPGIGGEVLSLLQAQQPPSPETVMTLLVNDLVESAAGDVVLALDDYHVITAGAIHEGIAFLVEHAPPQFHLVITTREDPPLPLPRLRSRGLLQEVRAADLRFTPDETALFLNAGLSLALSEDEAGALAARTEGWAAGLQLAALSMPGQVDRAAFIRDFAGSARYITDYLVDEVMRRLTEAQRAFLLRTSVLSRLSGPLCDAVTEDSSGQEMLEWLERANLFLTPLDGERVWYRYHHLFAEMLRNQLQRQEPGLAPVLHLRAAIWYEEAGPTTEAIEHRLSAGDFAGSARLIGPIAWPTINAGQSATVRRWIGAFPVPALHARPELCVAYAWALILTGEVEALQGLVQVAEEALQGAENPGTLVQLLLLQANWARMIGDGAQAVGLAERTLALAGAKSEWRTPALMALGDGHLLLGNFHEAEQRLTEAITVSRSSGGSPYTVVLAVQGLTSLGKLRCCQGRMREAEQHYREALALIGEADPVQRQKGLGVRVPLGSLYIEWNDLDEASRQITPAAEGWASQGNQPYIVPALQALAQLHQAAGKLEEAHAVLQRALAAAHKIGAVALTRSVKAQQARLHLAAGRLGEAEAWLHGLGSDPGGPHLYPGAAVMVTRAHIDLALGRVDAALATADEVLTAADDRGWTALSMEALLIKALALDGVGEGAPALAAMVRLVTLAQAGHYVRLFLDAGEPMKRLLERLARGIRKGEQSAPADYVARLLAAFSSHAGTAESPAPPDAQPTPTLLEPLSGREVEVLKCVAEGLSNPDIAGRLFIAPGTVKVHLKNIFSKLGAGNRVTAIEIARRYHLL